MKDMLKVISDVRAYVDDGWSFNTSLAKAGITNSKAVQRCVKEYPELQAIRQECNKRRLEQGFHTHVSIYKVRYKI